MDEYTNLDKWHCTCGAENSGEFCTVCGAQKNENTADDLWQYENQQTTVLPNFDESSAATAISAEKIDCQNLNAENKGTDVLQGGLERTSKQTPFENFKNFCNSTCVAVLFVFATVLLGTTLIGLVVSIVDLALISPVLSGAIGPAKTTMFCFGTLTPILLEFLLSLFLTISVWRLRRIGRSKNPLTDKASLGVLKATLTTKEIYYYFTIAAYILVAILMADSQYSANDNILAAKTYYIVHAVAYCAMVVLFAVPVSGFLKDIACLAQGNTVPQRKHTFAAIMFFVVGVAAVATLFNTSDSATYLTEFLSARFGSENEKLFSSVNSVPIVTTIRDISTVGIYGSLGISAYVFDDKILSANND